MYQVFYFAAVAALLVVLFGAAQSETNIIIYGVAAAVLFYFMGAVLNSLSDILKAIKKPGNGESPKPDKADVAKDVKPSADK